MNRRFSIAQRFAARPGKDGLDFRNQRERQFFWRFRAEIETSGRKNFRVDRDPFIEHGVEQLIAAFPRTEQTDIRQIEFQQLAKRREIATVIMRLHNGGGSTVNVTREISRLIDLKYFPTQNLRERA